MGLCKGERDQMPRQRLEMSHKISEREPDSEIKFAFPPITNQQNSQVYNHALFGEIETVVKNKEIYFVAADVARALQYDKTSNMLRRLDDDEKAEAHLTSLRSVEGEQVIGQNRIHVIINEPGLYNAIFGSKLQAAKEFKRWVTHEVLPEIRKNGYYSVDKMFIDPITGQHTLHGYKHLRDWTLFEEFLYMYQDDLDFYELSLDLWRAGYIERECDLRKIKSIKWTALAHVDGLIEYNQYGQPLVCIAVLVEKLNYHIQNRIVSLISKHSIRSKVLTSRTFGSRRFLE